MRAILFLILTLSSSVVLRTQPDPTKDFVIAFGSCNKQEAPQPLWDPITAAEPDVWIWLGDNVYADTEDMNQLADCYRVQDKNVGYQRLKEQAKVYGTWDDHDYGVNDGDRRYPMKKESRDLALQFLEVPTDAEVWKREGLYQSHLIEYGSLTVRLILLDTRYFKDPIARDENGYVPDPNADLLGEEQWAWLKSELAKDEDVLLIANGTQVLPQDHPFEKWANYPRSRKRLLRWLKRESCDRIILLSGDRHIGELSSIVLGRKEILEATSSGLTHSYNSVGEEPNRHRVGDLTSEKNFGLLRISKDIGVTVQLRTKDGIHLEHKMSR